MMVKKNSKIFSFLKNLKIFSAVIFIVVFILYSAPPVKAGASHNVSGFAWSENIGWVSFNSSNCDTDNNGQSNGGTGCPATGAAISNYGVNLDASGILSGYGWSENIGWVSFNRSDTGAPPTSPDYGTYLAKVDLTTKEASGWLRVLANGGGWDGWLKMRGTNYGVWLDNSVSPAEFRNWSWSDMVMGWMSFNCADRGVCGTSNYKVVTNFSGLAPSPPPPSPTPSPNQPPCASCGAQGGDSGGPAVEYQRYCDVFSGQGQVGLKWVYQDADGDPETRFDFRVNNVNNPQDANPEVDRSFTGLNNATGTVNNQSVLVKDPLETDKIEFGKTYYWWVKVYDDQGNNSGWATGSAFTVPNHAYPWIEFSWSPENPKVNELTRFNDDSAVFSGRQNRNWAWTFQDANPSSASNQNPVIRFISMGEKQIDLRVTDSTGYSCTGRRSLDTQIPLPEWQEITPFSAILNFFAEIPKMAKSFFKNLDLGYFVR